jgi:hypothetical protein
MLLLLCRVLGVLLLLLCRLLRVLLLVLHVIQGCSC